MELGNPGFVRAALPHHPQHSDFPEKAECLAGLQSFRFVRYIGLSHRSCPFTDGGQRRRRGLHNAASSRPLKLHFSAQKSRNSASFAARSGRQILQWVRPRQCLVRQPDSRLHLRIALRQCLHVCEKSPPLRLRDVAPWRIDKADHRCLGTDCAQRASGALLNPTAELPFAGPCGQLPSLLRAAKIQARRRHQGRSERGRVRFGRMAEAARRRQ